MHLMHPLKELFHKFRLHISPALHVWWIRNKLPAQHKLAVIQLMLQSLFESELELLYQLYDAEPHLYISFRDQGFCRVGLADMLEMLPRMLKWFPMLQIFLITSANALRRSMELFQIVLMLKFVSNHPRPWLMVLNHLES